MSHVAVIFAFPIEARQFVKLTGNRRPIGPDTGACTCYIGGVQVYVEISGVGRERSESKSREVMAGWPAAVVAAGFSGALDDDLSPGDLVLAESVVDAASEPAVTYACDSRLLEFAEQAASKGRRSWRRRRVATAAWPTLLPEEKSDLSEQYNCAAVDMESGPAAAAAAEFGVPFIAVRCIVDRRQDIVPLPLADVLRPDGTTPIMDLVIGIIKQPGLIGAAARLAAQSRTAGRALADFLALYLPRVGRAF